MPVLQSILFNKKYFTLAGAKAWLKKNNYKITFNGKKYDSTINFYRFRQAEPRRGVKYYFVNPMKGLKLLYFE